MVLQASKKVFVAIILFANKNGIIITIYQIVQVSMCGLLQCICLFGITTRDKQ